MVIVGIDLGTQSLKAVVCDERLAVRGSHAVAVTTERPRAGWAEQDPRAWEAALAPAIGGALADAGMLPTDVAAVGIAGQLDGCVAVDGSGEPLHRALIWQDRRAIEHASLADRARLFELTGQIADPSHLAPKLLWLRAHGIRAARFHQPTSYLVERLTGVAALDPAHASTTMLFDLLAGTWSEELLDAFAIDSSELPAILPAHALAGALTAGGAELTGLAVDTPVVVGTGDDFATPLGAGIVSPGHLVCALGTAEVVGTLADSPVFDLAATRSAIDRWQALAEPMVETHAYPTGAFFVENPGWLSGGAVRWATQLLGLASDAELDAIAATAPPGADGVTFVPALAGAMTPVWRPHARATLHGLTASHDRSHIARAVLEGLAFACRDVAQRLGALGLPVRDAIVLGGGGHSRVWTQIRADALGLPHRIAARTDTCAIGAAMLAAVAAGMHADVHAAASFAPPAATAIDPASTLDDAYDRYRLLVASLAALSDEPWL